MSQAQNEIKEGKRFAFGKNWSNFLKTLSDDRICQAENDLKDMLNVENLKNLCFLDIGSGSGLSSLAAKRLGAKVFSFDFDQIINVPAGTPDRAEEFSALFDSISVQEGATDVDEVQQVRMKVKDGNEDRSCVDPRLNWDSLLNSHIHLLH